MFETALLEDARKEISRLHKADIVIGIPSYRNARTIAAVTRVAAQAASIYFPTQKTVIINVDSNSSDGTANAFMRLRLPPDISRFSTCYQGLVGHGSSVRAIFEISAALEARACVVLDPTTTELSAEQLKSYLEPILKDQTHLVVPAHQWSDAEVTFEDLVVYPLSCLAYGKRLRRLLPGDFALAGRLALAYAEQDVWETDAARSGLDMWLMIMALASSITIEQVPSCHKSTNLVFGTTAYEQHFNHTVSTLLRYLGPHQRIWREENHSEIQPPVVAPPIFAIEERPVEQYWHAFQQGMRQWKRLLKRVLQPENHESLLQMTKMTPEDIRFDGNLWARMLMDFGVCFNKAELDPDKVAASLATPFYARSIALWNQIDSEGTDGYEFIIAAQAAATERERDYLAERWDNYIAWVSDSPVR